MAETPTLKSPDPHAVASHSPTSARTPVAAMLSHRGRVRHANQDACAALAELGAFVVCDGMGGAAAGEIASHLAAEAFLHALSQPAPHATPPQSPNGPGETPDHQSATPADRHSITEHQHALYPAHHPHTRLREAVRAANQAVFSYSCKSPALRGMGTTLVGALWDDSHPGMLWLAHVGDSRCYRLRRGTLHLLTEDHSLVEEQVRAGTLSRVQAAVSPIRNIITRAVGSEPSVDPAIASHPTQSGDLYLLATDGLTRELDDAEIARILSHHLPRSGPTLQAACQALIDAANAHGGHDNITVLLIAFP